MKPVIGYNIYIKYGTKTFCGVTSDDFSLTKNTKESITKDEKGNSTTTVTGNSAEITVAGMMRIGEDGDSTKMCMDDIMEMALKVGSEAILKDVVYFRGEGNKSYKFDAVITSYQETTPADGDCTYSLKLKVNGEMTLNQ